MQKQLQINISESMGSVSAALITGNTVDAVMTLAHGAGADMNHSFMVSLANELAVRGIASLRFNFHYMEHHKKRPDVPAVAHKVIEAAINKAHELFPDAALFVSGKSFGGRMSSQYLSNNLSDFVKGIIFFGFPLHPAGKPATDRAEHLQNLNLPSLFIQGTKDALAEWNLIEGVVTTLPKGTLYKLEGADHSFKAGKLNLIPVLAQASKDWMTKQL